MSSFTYQPFLDLMNAVNDWRTYGDATSLMLIAASIADWLPPVAAALSIVWVSIRIYETDTVQNIIWNIKHRGKHGRHKDDS